MTEEKNGISAALTQLINDAPAVIAESAAALQYLDQFQGLKVVDRETYNAAKAYASEVRRIRLELAKKITGAVSAFKVVVKNYEGEANKVIALYGETEKAIRSEIQRYDDERKAEKEAAERAAALVFMQRTTSLFEVGFTFDGYAYKCGVIMLLPDAISAMSDSDLAEYIAKGREESARIAAIMTAAQAQVKEEPLQQLPNVKPAQAPAQNIDWFDAPPADVSPITEESILTPVEPPKVETDFKPAGFTAGFDACKKAILDILAKDQKFTRSELVRLIKELKA